MNIFLGIVLLAAVVIAGAIVRPIKVQVRIIHDYNLPQRQHEDKSVTSLEGMEAEKQSAYRRATKLIKPWFERRARGKRVTNEKEQV